MFVIVGLGNPGREYNNTRHNIGFEAINYLAKMYSIDVDREKFKGVYGEGFIKNKKVILLKPTTYMNLSGESIKSIMDFYKLTEDKIIVIYDDISLPIGRFRVREKGSAGGHNGIKSIISHLGTNAFSRIKIGVGEPKGNLVSHVLGKFSKADNEIISEILEAVVGATETIIEDDIREAMNKYNGFISVKANKVV